jgi:catechol 2,3-dioxygenase-like lactoylglutathione lyase family enzyme
MGPEAPAARATPRRGAMEPSLDHLILRVNDRQESIRFFTEILGFGYEGERDPFSVIRVNRNLVLQLAPWGTEGGEHLAFAMTEAEFEQVFQRIRQAGIAYGDSFHAVGNQQGPGDEAGARGPGKALYCFDPSRHLIEIRFYG